MNIGFDQGALANLQQQVLKAQDKFNTGAKLGETTGTDNAFGASLANQLIQGVKSGELQGRVQGLIDKVDSSAVNPGVLESQPMAALGGGRRAFRSGDSKGIVGGLVDAVDAKQKVAAESRRAFLSGESNNLHQTMIASQEASVAFSLMVEMRNKVMEAYQELMRIQV
jgi:flagellar hook-basal body complex protein FliE